MGIADDALSSVTGNVDSALIIVKDYRLAGQEGGMAGIAALNATTQTMLEKGINPMITSAYANMDKTFRVQFNPKELQVNANTTHLNYADSRVKDKTKQNISDNNQKPTLDLSLNLIFDHVNVFDAFMWDKIRNIATANGMVGAAASAVKVFTVQTEVEGFLAAIRNQFTRNVTFQWGNFSFVGQLINVSVQYTMFSTTGRPIRANVALRIRHEMDDELLENNWYQYFTQAFSGAESNLVGAQQYVQSLINLGL